MLGDVKHTMLMANLVLTTKCQRSCDYCFSQHNDKTEEFSWNNFIKALEFVSTDYKTINLLGGEPTFHKDFVRMLEHLLVNDYNIQVFTNGMINSTTLEGINDVVKKTAIREGQLWFCININEDKYRTREEIRLQNRFLNTLGRLIYPSFVIHDKDVNLFFLLDTIKEYNLDKTIKLGFSMPIYGIKNKYLPISLYENAKKSIIKIADNSPGITIVFDCGFPLCIFTMEEIGMLSKNEKNDFVFSCSPAIDIYPDLSISYCFALSKMHRAHIDNFPTLNDAYEYFNDGFSTPTGIYGEKCLKCTFFRQVCAGGCKGFYRPQKEGGGEWEELNGKKSGN